MVFFYSCKSYKNNVIDEVPEETSNEQKFEIKTGTHSTPSSFTGNNNSNGDKGSKPKK